MSTRTNLRPQAVLTAGDMSGSLTSLPTILQSLTRVSYGLSWAGTSPVGTVSVQCSNDYSVFPTGVVNNAGTWNALTFDVGGSPVSAIPISGNSGNGFIDIDGTAAYAIRLIYTRVSGTGSLTAVVNGKVS